MKNRATEHCNLAWSAFRSLSASLVLLFSAQATPLPESTTSTCPLESEDAAYADVTPPASTPTQGVQAQQETYKYVGPTTDFTGVQLIYEKKYNGNTCVGTKKFYYCAPCSDLNDEHPSIWIDPATAKFIFEPPYLIGGQKTLKELNHLSVEIGGGNRLTYDFDPDEVNPNFPLAPPSSQKQSVIIDTATSGTVLRTFTLEAP